MTEQVKSTDRLLWALQERAKELSCLYEIEELLNRPETPLDDVFPGVVRAIPPGWQYPHICRATVEHEGKMYREDEFPETPWVQSADIVVQDKVVGRISVSYTQEMPQADEGPFLKEEGKLIRTIADRIGHFILHQKLRDVFQEWHVAQEVAPGRSNEEWRVALRLLRRTDQELFIRISRKMANHLCWSGIPEAQLLLQGLGQARRAAENAFLGEKNQPIERMPPEEFLNISDQVFSLASTRLSDDEILNRIQRWIHEDRATFLVKAIMDERSSPTDILDSIRRYQHLAREGAELPAASLNAVKVALIRRFLSVELEYLKVAKDYVDFKDIQGLIERLIALPGSHGRVGGKAAGVFLGSQILKKAAGDHPALGHLRTPKTWYLASDGVIEFVRYNNLEEVYEQKYKSIDRVRQEYPHIVQVFQNSHFPAEIVKGLAMALDDFGDRPLIVRSSSLLEDRLGAAFSGKYKSLFIANEGDKRQRLDSLMGAIAEVYSSIFSPDPIQYRAERGLLDFHEEMGILIQEVVGTRVGGYFFPAFAGVAFSNNEFRWSPRIKREDGLIRLVPGLGTRAVDRVAEDYPILVAPGQPRLRVNVTPEEVVRYSPQKMDVINMEERALESVDVRDVLRSAGSSYPQIERIVSVLEEGRVAKSPAFLLDFDTDRLVVTFDGLISDTDFVPQMGSILKILQQRLSTPVDIEFASDGRDFYLLQCRPQSYGGESAPAAIPQEVPQEKSVFSAKRYVSNGRVPDITHIVYVDPESYSEIRDEAQLMAVGRAVGRLNQILPKRQFILMGPGRWGSRGDIRLGVNVTYSDINNTAMLIEIARKKGNYLPDLSFGTHFFQDLVEASIRYLPLYPDDAGVLFNERFLSDSPNELETIAPEFASVAGTLKLIDVPRATGGMVLRVVMNAELDEALAYFASPGTSPESSAPAAGKAEDQREDHWRWRLRMAEKIASILDPDRFGVKALFVIGSTKNATAGPASDIDLLVHFAGSPSQRDALRVWLEGWSLCLAEMNYLRTGYPSDGLLDVQLITDEDIAHKSSFAVKIGAVTDAARELPVKKK